MGSPITVGGTPADRAHRFTIGSRATLLVCLFAALGMIGSACGSGGGDDGDSGSGSLSDDDTATEDGAGTPEYGGEIAYGLEAESSGGWCLPEGQLAISGIQVARTMFDTLTAPNADGEITPFLAESMTPNDDYTQWTFKLREGIKFHDGSDLTAEVVKNNLDAYRGTYPARQPLLFRFVFEDIESVDVVDPMTVTVTTKVPWPAFPWTLYGSGRVGMIAQAQLDDPETCDINPIGTGPFKFVSWNVNESLVTERNDDYWQTDAEGNKLPYLDGVTYQPITDESARVNALESGAIQAMHTNDGFTIEQILAGADGGTLGAVQVDELSEVTNVMFNVTKPPFDNKLARQIVATGLDVDGFIEITGAGQFKAASGPFAKGVIGYLEDAGFPSYDQEEAKKLAEQYESETGAPLSFVMQGGNNDAVARQLQYIQDQMKQIGVEVEIKLIEQAALINEALGGNWEAMQFRNFPGADPDTEYNWWYTNSPVNFGKFADPEIDRMLDQGRQMPDGDERTKLYEDLNRRFGSEVYYSWLNWSNWTIGTEPNLHGVLGPTLPDGTEPAPALPMGHPVSGIWISQG
ncbi:MAG: ABC transporter substrate-binding protein [Microthrixaceae bacterium]